MRELDPLLVDMIANNNNKNDTETFDTVASSEQINTGNLETRRQVQVRACVEDGGPEQSRAAGEM